jgi:hypothetical protein
MKGHPIPYSAQEMAWLEANKLLPISDYHRGFCDAFGRHDVPPNNLHALRKRKGWKTGRTGCFENGQAPHNKGVSCAPGVGGRHPNAVRTQFQKGHGRSGVAVKLYKAVGSERLSKNGYLERKIHDGMPLQSRWRAVHLIEWEEAHGPIPAGHCLKCRGDITDTSPENWMLIPRALLPALNGGRHKRRLAYDRAAPEVRETLLTLAKIEHRARQLQRRAQAA